MNLWEEIYASLTHKVLWLVVIVVCLYEAGSMARDMGYNIIGLLFFFVSGMVIGSLMTMFDEAEK